MIFFSPLQAEDQTSYRFVYLAPNSEVRKVNVVGTFNNWNKDHDPLLLDPDGKTWSVKLALPYGKIQYKFVVNGDNWITDPLGKSVADGEGHTNSEVLIVPPDYLPAVASRLDGITAKSALLHQPQEPQLNFDRGSLQFQFRARYGDLSQVDLLANGKKDPMTSVAHDDLFEQYQAQLPWNQGNDVSYSFEIHDGNQTHFYDSGGYSDSPTKPFVVRAKGFKPYEVPDWTQHAVIYQIFPDRFADGDPTNDPKGVQPSGAIPTYSNRFGGDAVGVEQHADYLKSLGIGAVYFNPVFASPSNHRYDTTDYLKIDPEFGTNEEFGHMTEILKGDGIRTVMDFAFNHTAPTFFAFKDIEKNGASSKFVPWYFIKSYPVEVKENPPYVAWYNYPSMPKLNVVNPDTETYILGAVDYWRTHSALAGVRLDVANEVDPKLWRDLRVHVKAKDPSFWIVGEDWGNANPWLHGDQWDSTMGYEFRGACLDFFANKTQTPTQFTDRLMKLYAEYPPQVSRNLMNLLGSHDTPRFLTLCNGNEGLLKLAATIQLTWPGTPCIYYGDELGMKGGADPDNRRMMDWSAVNRSNKTLSYYKALIAIRNRSTALQQGDPKILSTNDSQGTFAYSRSVGEHSAIIAINASARPRTMTITIPASGEFSSLRAHAVDALTGHQFTSSSTLSLSLPPLGAALLIPREDLDPSSLPQSASRTRRLNLSGHRSPNPSQGAI